jgi:hypothetical protein
MVTPFDEKGRVDEDAFVGLVHHLLENGSDGLVVTATTGEAPTLTDEEKERLWQLALSEAGGAPVIAGTGTYVVLKILDVPYAVPLAVLMAFLDLIPLVGATIGGVVIGIVAAIADFPTALIVWGIYFIVYQQIENNLLQPLIYRRTVAIHPLLVLVAVLIGGSQLGVLGALLAIPVAAGIQIVVKDWWRVRKLRIAVTGADSERPPSDVAPETP